MSCWRALTKRADVWKFLTCAALRPWCRRSWQRPGHGDGSGTYRVWYMSARIVVKMHPEWSLNMLTASLEEELKWVVGTRLLGCLPSNRQIIYFKTWDMLASHRCKYSFHSCWSSVSFLFGSCQDRIYFGVKKDSKMSAKKPAFVELL